MGRRIRPPTPDQKAGTWDDVVKEAERASRRAGAQMANRLEKVFLEHAYAMRVDWTADMAEKLLDDLILVNTDSIRTVFGQHLARWRRLEAEQAAEEQDDG